MEFSKLKVPELKQRLKAMGLSTSGRKQTLIERLNLGNQTNNPDVTSIRQIASNTNKENETFPEALSMRQPSQDPPMANGHSEERFSGIDPEDPEMDESLQKVFSVLEGFQKTIGVLEEKYATSVQRIASSTNEENETTRQEQESFLTLHFDHTS